MKEIETLYFSVNDSRFTSSQIDALVKSFSVVFRKKLKDKINMIAIPFTVRVFVSNECLFTLLLDDNFDFITGDVPNTGQDLLDFRFTKDSFVKFVNLLDISLFNFEKITILNFNGIEIKEGSEKTRYETWLLEFFEFMIEQISILLHSKCGTCNNVYRKFPPLRS